MEAANHLHCLLPGSSDRIFLLGAVIGQVTKAQKNTTPSSKYIYFILRVQNIKHQEATFPFFFSLFFWFQLLRFTSCLLVHSLGSLHPRYGRKPVFFIAMALQTIFTFVQIFSNSWIAFCVLLFISGIGQISNYMSAFVLGIFIHGPIISRKIFPFTL